MQKSVEMPRLTGMAVSTTADVEVVDEPLVEIPPSNNKQLTGGKPRTPKRPVLIMQSTMGLCKIRYYFFKLANR